MAAGLLSVPEQDDPAAGWIEDREGECVQKNKNINTYERFLSI